MNSNEYFGNTAEQDPQDKFQCQIPFWSYSPAEYRNSEDFANLTPILDGFLEKLLGEGSLLDSANGNVLDTIIADYARKNFRNLAQQRVTHMGQIRALEVQRRGAQRSFEQKSKEVMEKLKAAESRLAELVKRYQSSFFVSNERRENEE